MSRSDFTTAERDAWVKGDLAKRLKSASSSALDGVDTEVSEALDVVFAAKARGFREIILTVVLATLIDPDYRSSVDLYACNPRALYEKGIRPALEDFNVPCGQSGPLNIAKAAPALDDSWAAQRRPLAAAQATLSVVACLEADSNNPEMLADALAYLFREEAQLVEELRSKVPDVADIDWLFDLSSGLIAGAPDGGNTAQRVCGYLLEQSLSNSTMTLSGHADSASTTNATSNKPGDLAVTHSDGTVAAVYEITTKPFTNQRISECSQSLRSFNAKSGEQLATVKVLCRRENAPEFGAADGRSDAGVLAVVLDAGTTYEFFEIETWIAGQLINLTADDRKVFFATLREYVNQPNTRRNVKETFRNLTTGREDAA
jgi:hypothetical protein